MSFAQVYTRSVVGLHAPQVIIEVHLSQGLPALTSVLLLELCFYRTVFLVNMVKQGGEKSETATTINAG